MFVFNNSEDRDLRTYQYELYEDDQVTGTYPNFSLITNAVPLSSGNSNSSVFTVAVDGSYVDELGVEQPKDYYGRVRSIDTSSNSGEWTSILKTDQSTPLIDEQYIVRLTADRIKAGTIESAEIVLGGANPAETIIRSSTYDSATPTTGWYIRGNGQASIGGPNGINFNGSILSPTITLGSNVTILSGAAVPNSSGVAFSGLTISTAVGTIGGIQLGSDANNQWLTSGYFRTGNSTKYMEYNPAGSGSLVFTGSIQIGTGESVFKADTNGIYLGNETFASAEFRVTPAGALTATNANITGTITATSGTFAGTITSDTGTQGVEISGGYIKGLYSSGIQFRASSGSSYSYINGENIFTGYILASSGVNDIYIWPEGEEQSLWTSAGIEVGHRFTIRAPYLTDDDLVGFYKSTSSTIARFRSVGGYQYLSGGTSLRKYKENINDIPNALEILSNLRPRVYNYKVDAFEEKDPITGQPWTEEARQLAQLDIKYGLIVEEVLETNPELISYAHEKTDIPYDQKGGYADLSSWKPEMWEEVDVITLCVKAIQELLTKVDELESRLI
jgi:hypothetical protein